MKIQNHKSNNIVILPISFKACHIVKPWNSYKTEIATKLYV